MMRILPVVVLALGSGCLSGDPTGKSQTEVDLVRNRDLFAQNAPASYELTWQQSCFCGAEVTDPIRITVNGTNLTKAVYVADQQPVSASVRDTLKTIPAVFELIRQMLERDADEVTVEYDPAMHYPTAVFIDIDKNASDEERDIHLSDLVFPASS